MKVKEFIKGLELALAQNTCYLQGGFGQRLWVPDWYNANYSWNKSNAYIINLHSGPQEKCYGFDCVCLIKGVIWGYAADPSKEYGGTVYKSNGLGDITTQAMAASCADLSTNWDKDPEPGELVFYDAKCSHVGVYVGNGEVIESTPAWDCGVQRTLLPNRLNPNKLPVRAWYSHGHTSYIDYSSEAQGQEPEQGETEVPTQAADPSKKDKVALIAWIQDLEAELEQTQAALEEAKGAQEAAQAALAKEHALYMDIQKKYTEAQSAIMLNDQAMKIKDMALATAKQQVEALTSKIESAKKALG